MPIDHVQLACPPGSEAALRAFYVGVLGMTEKPKPRALASRGGCWFTAYGIDLHLGVDREFRPARKAHPGMLWPDLDRLAARLAAAGHPVLWADPDEIPGVRRFHTEDPYGNRLEFLTRESVTSCCGPQGGHNTT
jgi:catechol 2,3-dioxygenase-like lactoylglutathione lyase family enzyme